MTQPFEHWGYRYPLFWAAAALILGAKLAPLVSSLVPFCLLTVSLFFAWMAHRLAFVPANRQRIVSALCMFVVLACLGMWRGQLAMPSHGDSISAVATRKSEPLAARAVIETCAVWRPNPNYRPEDPASQPWKTQWTVRLQSVLDCDSWKAVDAKSTLQCEGRVDAFLPGDVIELHGSYRRIYQPTNPGAFDFATHSQLLGQFVLLSVDTERQMQRIGLRPNYLLQRSRGMAIRQVDRWLRKWVTQGQSPLAAALVFGQREQVDWQDQQELMATGTLHMLAISGMHVEIVAWGVLLMCALAPVSDRMRLLLLIFVCGFYAALADGKPPVLRAVILVSLFEVSRSLGRRGRLVNLLSVAAIALFCLRASNIDNVGVHLSFLAVATIGVFVLEEAKQRESQDAALRNLLLENAGPGRRIALMGWQWTRSMIRLSFWVWLMTCPLVWVNFNVVAPVAIPLNVIIAIPLAISLLAGLMTGLFGWLPPVGWLAGCICGTGLRIIGWLVECGHALPGGHYWLPPPSLWWMLIFYFVVIGWLLLCGKKRRGWLALLLFAWLGVGIGGFALGPRGFWGASNSTSGQADPNGLSVTFLDVGHGSSVIIQEPQGSVWLYDAGHLGAPERSFQEIAAALWALGTARIDTLVISHADADHYNATPGLLERFSIGRVVSTAEFWHSQDRHVTELADHLKQHRVDRLTWAAGEAGTLGDLSWKVLHPRTGERWESDNASSLCLLLSYRDKRILLPGDLEGSGLRTLTHLPERPCHVLMAPHHGSLTIDPSEMLTWCQPQLVVVSGNHRAIRPRVVEKYAAPHSVLGITFRDGAVQYRVSPSGETSVWRWCNRQWEQFAGEDAR